MVKLNEEHEFLLVVERFGNLVSTIEISTVNYVLMNTQVTDNEHKMFKSVTRSQLKSILMRMKFESFEIPYEKMFIATFSDVLSTVGQQSMKLLITRFSSSHEQKTIFHLRFISFLVHMKENYCLPSVHLSSCENSRAPREILVNEFNFFKPIVQRSCGENSTLRHKWSIDHFVNQKTMKNLPEEQSSSLKLPPFAFRFNDDNDFFMGFYTIKLITFEDDYVNKGHGINIWRVRRKHYLT